MIRLDLLYQKPSIRPKYPYNTVKTPSPQPEEMMTDDPPLYSPPLPDLNLSDKRISHLAVSLSRTTLLTEDNQIAVLVDPELDKISSLIQVT